MSTFVLLHGAWHGGWAWDAVGAILRRDGHAVVTPALAGAADGPAADRATGLGTHGDAVAALLRGTREPVILVGHSYAGLVASQAAAQVPQRVAELVLIDGWLGPPGRSLYDLAPAWLTDTCDTAAAERGDGWLIPPPPPEMFGITDAHQAERLRQRLSPHPLATFTEPATAAATADRLPGRALTTRGAEGMPFAELSRAAGYPVQHLDSVHDAMIADPDLVAAALLS